MDTDVRTPRAVAFRWAIRLLRMVGYVVLILVLVVVVMWLTHPVDETSPQDVPVLSEGGGDFPLQIVALGDSFVSGEGAVSFLYGTDIPGTNTCHRAPTAYPLVVAQLLEARLPLDSEYSGVEVLFAACSGAETINVGSSFRDPDTVPVAQFEGEGGQPLQIEIMQEGPDADIILIGLGGNDARFRDVVLTCAGRAEGCEEMAQPWIDRLDAGALGDPNAQDGVSYVMQSLQDVFSEVRSAAPTDAMIYAMTYPNPLSADSCRHVGLDAAETRFVRDYFLDRLNAAVLLAASNAGIKVIDLADIFDNSGLCAVDEIVDGPAMNGFKFQQTSALPTSLSHLAATMQGSMHPKEAGHALIAERVASALELELQYRDTFSQSASAPVGPDGVPMQGPDRLPPIVPGGLPDGTWVMRDNPCAISGTVYAVVKRAARDLVITDASPGGVACVAAFAQDFAPIAVGADGSFTVSGSGEVSVAGLGGRRDTIYQRADGQWMLLAEVSPPGAPQAQLSEIEAWLGSGPQAIWVVAAISTAALVLLITIDWLIVGRHERRAASRS